MTIKSAVVRHPWPHSSFLKVVSFRQKERRRPVSILQCSSRGRSLPFPFPFGLSHAFGSYFIRQTISEYSEYSFLTGRLHFALPFQFLPNSFYFLPIPKPHNMDTSSPPQHLPVLSASDQSKPPKLIFSSHPFEFSFPCKRGCVVLCVSLYNIGVFDRVI